MEHLNIILDTTHLCEDSFWHAIDYNSHIWVSHSHVWAIVDLSRQFPMEQIKALIEKGATIGGALDAWMTVPG